MNFLAHIYLSFDDPEIQVGNFIADSVRESQLDQFHPKVQKGVRLHWEIDRYTDSHPVVKESKKLLYDRYSKYAAVLVDIFYDHYLARDWGNYHEKELGEYTQSFYRHITSVKSELPDRIQHMIPYMVQDDWLYNYQHLDGMRRVLGGMSRRASFESGMEKGVEDLQRHDAAFEQHFQTFFPDLVKMSQDFLKD